MAYKRFFCSLTGEDYSIIRQNSRSLINLFVAIGVFVFFIFALCFVSLSLLFLNLFEVDFFAAILAFFFAWMITNIYLLILYTLSKNPFGDNKRNLKAIIPKAIKYCFIIFISLLISKPMEVFVFSKELNRDLLDYRREQLLKYTVLTKDYFDQGSKQIQDLLKEEKDSQLHQALNQDKILQYEKILVENEKKKNDLVTKMDALISKSSFYTQQIMFLSKRHQGSWLVSLIVMVVFLLPAVLKNFISARSKFYMLKKEIETQIVLEEYANFKERYNQIMQGAFGAGYSWIELHDDPPFNYSRKVKNINAASEADFLKSLYQDGI